MTARAVDDTAPAATSSATSERLMPVTIAMMRSTRSPASASGTTSVIRIRRRPSAGGARTEASTSRPMPTHEATRRRR